MWNRLGEVLMGMGAVVFALIFGRELLDALANLLRTVPFPSLKGGSRQDSV